MAIRYVTKEFHWHMGHRVLGHQGKCRHLHGHTYRAEITCYAEELDGLGMVVDFGVIKEVVGKWIDNNLDHRLMLHPDDPRFLILTELEEPMTVIPMVYMVNNKLVKANPTAENIAQMLYHQAEMQLTGDGLWVVQVRVWETPTASAIYRPAESC